MNSAEDNILVIGGSGLVGNRFYETSRYRGRLLIPRHERLDITNHTSIDCFLGENNIQTVINFAAYTNVGEAEKQRGDYNGDCWRVNVSAIENLMPKLARGTHFIQISTDMIFPGSKENPGPYDEASIQIMDESKVTWYGFSKNVAEYTTDYPGINSSVVRIIYPVRARYDKKTDYLRKPLALFDQRKLYPLFSDQQISISFIDEVTMALDKIIETHATGVFHVACPQTTTPYEIVSYLLEKTRGMNDAVVPSSLADKIKNGEIDPIRYPRFGGLKSDSTMERLGIRFRGLHEVVDELTRQGIGN